MQSDSMFHLTSMIKAVVAVALMQLVERGIVALDDCAGDLVPYIRDVQVLTGFDDDDRPLFRAPARPITIRHLLTHTAGFVYDFNDETTRRYLASVPVPARGSDADSEHPLVFDPGDHWMYGVSVDWIGRIVEVASGQRLDEVLREQIFDPLGMNDTTFTLGREQVERLATLQPAPRTDSSRRHSISLRRTLKCSGYSQHRGRLPPVRTDAPRQRLDRPRTRPLASETVEFMLADHLEVHDAER